MSRCRSALTSTMMAWTNTWMRGTSSSAMILRRVSQSCGAALTTSELVAGSAVTVTGLLNSAVCPAELAPNPPPVPATAHPNPAEPRPIPPLAAPPPIPPINPPPIMPPPITLPPYPPLPPYPATVSAAHPTGAAVTTTDAGIHRAAETASAPQRTFSGLRREASHTGSTAEQSAEHRDHFRYRRILEPIDMDTRHGIGRADVELVG